jgi:acyl transferase domain-containing protein
MNENNHSPLNDELHIAIIGIGCRYPGGANSPESYWELMRNGVDAVTEVPADRWDTRIFYHPDSGRPSKANTRWGGFIEKIDHFDPRFFGISPREAKHMDPQQRLLLEVAWEALEDGGQVLERVSGTAVGVFIGISTYDYGEIHHGMNDRELIDAHSNLGGAQSIAANRISYVFDLRGPSFSVDTACSSSLTAIHLATRSLRDGECKMALVGGVNAVLKPESTIGFSRASMLSPDGRCKAFDSRANGYTRAEGAGMVLLKPLKDALADGDSIYAVIRGSAINEDGRTSGITVPGRAAQEAMLREAYRRAGFLPGEVQYIEAHGTGTPVGDPIEAGALGTVLSEGRPEGNYCLMGSVKTNIGHLEAGAGMAGLIKVALMLRHKEIPPILHFQEPNPEIPFDALRLRIARALQPWPTNGNGPARAGVNSFGFGGANAHVVVEEAPQPQPTKVGTLNTLNRAYLLPLSARSSEALRAFAQSYREFLDRGGNLLLQDVAYTAGVRRTHHDYRLTVVGRSPEELSANLGAFLAGETRPGLASGHHTSGQRPKIAFVFSGMGPQWWMGRQLLAEEPVFRAAVERCDALLSGAGAAWSLLDEMMADESRSRIGDAEIAQPANFALQVGLFELWRSWGMEPDAIIGHSAGEVAAAYAAGGLSLEDAVHVIFHRSRLQHQATGKGKMAAVGLSLAEAERAIEGYQDRLSVAAINSPRSLTLSGDADALAEVMRGLEEKQVFCRLLQVAVPYHSPHMDPLEAELRQSLAGLNVQPTRIPYISTVTGERAAPGAFDAEYWWRNVRYPVYFSDGMNRLAEEGYDLFLELSPHPVLAGTISECLLANGKKGTTLPSLRRQEAERDQMLGSLGALHTLGCRVNWGGLYADGRTVRVPSYPWQRERYWQESEVARQSRLGHRVHPLLGRRLPSPQPAWESEIDQTLLRYLGDHQIQGLVVYPGAAYAEMALAAAREVHGEGPVALEELEFQKALFLSDAEASKLQLSFDPETGFFDIHSRVRDANQAQVLWMRHARGRIAQADQAVEAVALDAIRGRCAQDISDICYAEFRTLGLEYGPAFQGIEQLWQGEGEALARLRTPDDGAEYQVHPALIDYCFQAMLGTLLRGTGSQPARVYLPVKLERMRVFRGTGSEPVPAAGPLYCHARLTEHDAKGLEGDIRLCDEAGNVLIEFQGFRCQALEGARTDILENLADWLYEFQWELAAAPASEVGAAPAPASGESWLILADRGGVGQKLADRLTAQGRHPILIPAEQGPGLAEPISNLAGVIHLWSLDAPSPEQMTRASLEAAGEQGCISALHLVQALTREAAGSQPAQLWLVTRGAQAVEPGVDSAAPAQAALWGLGRVVMNEHPQMRCRLVDLDVAEDADAAAAQLMAELSQGDREEEIAFRGGRRYVHRLNRVPARVEDAGAETRIQAAEGQPFFLDIPKPGLLDGLTLRETVRQTPAAGEVEIQVFATGLNFRDVMKAMGIYPTEGDEKLWLGDECAGRIAAVGEGVTEFQVGDEVIAVAPACFSAFITTSAALVVPKPASLSFEEAATIPIVYLTVYYALHDLARLRAGERILIHAAAGGVGLAAIQYARHVGAEIFATAGSPEKRAYLHSLGVQHVMDSRSLAFADEIMTITGGEGVDVVLNSLAGDAIPKSISTLRAYGRFLEIGKRDIYQNSKLQLRPFRKNLSFFAIDLGRLFQERPAMAGQLLRDVMKLMDLGRRGRVPVHGAGEAHGQNRAFAARPRNPDCAAGRGARGPAAVPRGRDVSDYGRSGWFRAGDGAMDGGKRRAPSGACRTERRIGGGRGRDRSDAGGGRAGSGRARRHRRGIAGGRDDRGD